MVGTVRFRHRGPPLLLLCPAGSLIDANDFTTLLMMTLLDDVDIESHKNKPVFVVHSDVLFIIIIRYY